MKSCCAEKEKKKVSFLNDSYFGESTIKDVFKWEI